MSILNFLKKSWPILIVIFSLFLMPTLSLAAEAPIADSLKTSIFQQMMPLGTAWGYTGPPPSPFYIVFVVIRVLMMLLGTIFIVLIVYGGFVWMTAAGDENRVSKAKDVIRNGTIGVVLIIGAFAITRFVLGGLICSVSDDQWWCLFFSHF